MSSEIRFSIKYRVPPYIMYNVLTTESDICRFTQSESKFEKKKGGQFSMYNGSISGTIEELKENKKIILNWKFSNWPKTSLVIMNIKEKEGNECQLTIVIKDCPERDVLGHTIDFDNVKSGFKTQIFEKIETFCGFPINKDDDSSDED